MRWAQGVRRSAMAAFVALAVSGFVSRAQENPLGEVHTATPAPKPPDADTRTAAEKAADKVLAPLRVDVNLVLVPVTVTDPSDRLVTGLEKDNFQLFDNGAPQAIKSFATEDAPLSIGIVIDLSGSMQSKFARARKALTEFLRTCNPQDEFFVIGFNDRPAVIVDYTSDVEDVEARMVMLRPENRTAMIDAMYPGG